MRRWRLSRRWATPSSPARSGCAWPRRGRGPSISSTASTTPSSTTYRSWPSSDRPTGPPMGGSYQQEVDLASLFKDVCHQYVQTLTVPQQLPNLIDRAIRTALATHSPTCIIVPYDVQELDYEPPEHAFKMVPSSLGISWPTPGARRRGHPPGGRDPQRRLEGGHPGRPGSTRGPPGDHRGGRHARCRRGQGALGQGCPLRRPPMGDRLARVAGDPAELRADDGLRHPAHRRLQLPLYPVHAPAGPGPGHPDRHRRRLHRHALSLRGQPGRRRRQLPSRPSCRC